MKKITILTTLLTVSLLTGCQDHELEPSPSTLPQALGAWRTGGTGSDDIYSLARDPQGDLLMMGNQDGHFIAKYTNSGVIQWKNDLKQIADPSNKLVAVDATGTIYIAHGNLGSRDDFGQSGEGAVYLASYTKDGTFRWILSKTGSGSLLPVNIVTDEAGNTYMTGWFSGTVNFGSTELTSKSPDVKLGGREDIFLLKVTKEGTLQWVKQLGGNSADFGFGLALDQAGNVFMSGFTASGPTFEGIDVNGYTSFAVKYTPDGTQQWIDAVRQANWGEGRHIGVDGAGNSYVQTGAVTTKLNSNGGIEWHKETSTVSDIVVSLNGDFYLAATFSGTKTIEGQTLTSSGGTDVMIAKYDKNGSLKWVIREGGLQNEAVRKIVLGKGGIIHLLGTFEGTPTIAGTNLTSAGQTDNFVATYKE
ncbi:SBBP repeat-containing protein [Telluribacter humicola]|uniref:SBBP repeat-containing protein n=1 Tax=Telluribacter humicola TaxID=1720261 RepID=UPI001A96017C|nr:SBBP repeat-containing protein [Telluribacter humicola]